MKGPGGIVSEEIGMKNVIKEIKKEAETMAGRMKPNSNGFKPANFAKDKTLPYIKPARGGIVMIIPQERASWVFNPTVRNALKQIQNTTKIAVRIVPLNGFKSRR